MSYPWVKNVSWIPALIGYHLRCHVSLFMSFVLPPVKFIFPFTWPSPHIFPDFFFFELWDLPYSALCWAHFIYLLDRLCTLSAKILLKIIIVVSSWNRKKMDHQKGLHIIILKFLALSVLPETFLLFIPSLIFSWVELFEMTCYVEWSDHTLLFTGSMSQFVKILWNLSPNSHRCVNKNASLASRVADEYI